MSRTDPRVIRLLEARGFFPDPPPREPNQVIHNFIKRIIDPEGEGKALKIWFRYGWKNEEFSIPTGADIYVAGVPYKGYVRIRGQWKVLAYLDAAIAAAINLSIFYKGKKTRLLKPVALNILENPYAVINYPGLTPPVQAGGENPQVGAAG